MRTPALGGIAVIICAVCFSQSARAAEAASIPYQPAIHIKLRPFVVPPVSTAGVIVLGRINGGPPLRLLLDSGAQNVVLSPKAAARSGCTGEQRVTLVGAGTKLTREVRLARAEVVEIGSFTAHDVTVLIGGGRLADGIDGVAPLTLFSNFLIRLDLPHKAMDLLPLPAEFIAEPGAPSVRVSNDLLFVKCRYSGSREGFFLFDTGAAYTAISNKVASELSDPALLDASIALHGGVSDVDGHPVRSIFSLRAGSTDLFPGPVVAVDLSLASKHHQFDVQGLLGYSSLCDRVLVVNYRDSQIQIEN